MLVSLVVWWIALVECGLFPEATVGFSLVDKRLIVTMVTFRHDQMYLSDDKMGVGSFEFNVLIGRKRVNEAFFTGAFLKDRDNQPRINEMCDFCLEQNTGITYRSLWGLATGPWALHSWVHHICTTVWGGGGQRPSVNTILCVHPFPYLIGLMTTLSKPVPEYTIFNVTWLIWHLNTGGNGGIIVGNAVVGGSKPNEGNNVSHVQHE